MQDESYRQMQSEAGNWLKLGRGRILRALVLRHAGADRRLRILEIGAGVGQNVPVLQEFGSVDVLEVNPVGLEALRETPGIGQVFAEPIPASIEGEYDVVVALDVLEHLRDDEEATRWAGSLLVDGGVLIATVPAYQWLFGDHDVALEHFRRYTRERLVRALPADLSVHQAGYFVTLLFPLAALARSLSNIRGRLRLSSSRGAGRKQSAAVPAVLDSVFLRVMQAEARAIGRGARPPFGLSVFVVARRCRPEASSSGMEA